MEEWPLGSFTIEADIASTALLCYAIDPDLTTRRDGLALAWD